VSFFGKGAWQIIGIAAFLVITMCLNLCCTSKSSFYLDCNSLTQTRNQVAIVVKLWRAHQRASSNYGRSLFPVMAVIIESGAIYTACVASFAITFLARSNGQDIPMDTVTPLVVSGPDKSQYKQRLKNSQGVVFCLIVLQIHFQMRVLKPSSTGTNSRSLSPWRVHERALPLELRGGVDVYIPQHAITVTDLESDTNPESKTQCSNKP
jgi:hypothetical protein